MLVLYGNAKIPNCLGFKMNDFVNHTLISLHSYARMSLDNNFPFRSVKIAKYHTNCENLKLFADVVFTISSGREFHPLIVSHGKKENLKISFVAPTSISLSFN